jgi:hypothetical protein
MDLFSSRDCTSRPTQRSAYFLTETISDEVIRGSHGVVCWATFKDVAPSTSLGIYQTARHRVPEEHILNVRNSLLSIIL